MPRSRGSSCAGRAKASAATKRSSAIGSSARPAKRGLPNGRPTMRHWHRVGLKGPGRQPKKRRVVASRSSRNHRTQWRPHLPWSGRPLQAGGAARRPCT
eukprot:13403036-Alexandrium_andersonii.AAC.1